MQCLAQVHDAILIQYKETDENEILPRVIETMKIPFPITDINGKTRTCLIPVSAETGWNWGHYNHKENTDGLRGFTGTR